jgi:hypothetical protein
MTIRDPEVLEALRDEPELLALADAITETQKAPRASHRRALSRSAALVAVGAAVLLAVLLWPSSGGRNVILDRALAAIGNGPVLHLVIQAPSGQELVNLRTGRAIVPKVVLESWSDRKMKRFHFLYRVDGKVVAEFRFPQDRTKGTHVGAVDPAYVAIWSGYRQALADGKAKIAGKGSLYGHLVYWLRFSSPSNEVAVDRRTFKPIAFRSTTGTGRHFDFRVLLARTEPFTSSAFRRRTSRPSPFSGVSSFSSGGQVAPVGPSSPARPPLRAGSTIAGLELASVQQTQTVTDGKKIINGFDLVYGSLGGDRRSLTIHEAKRPDDSAEWSRLPKGFLRLEIGEGSDSNNRSYTIWTAYLVVDKVYVSIESGVSRAAVLEAARALRPA